MSDQSNNPSSETPTSRFSFPKRSSFPAKRSGFRDDFKLECYGENNVYKGLRMLHFGRCSNVILGQNVETKQHVILKSYAKTGGSETFQQYKAEVDILKYVYGIEGVVKILDEAQNEYYYYIVLEHFSGFNLMEVLANAEGRLDEVYAAQICQDLGRILSQLHSRGIVYRNLRPEHVIIGPHKTIHLIDFSLALHKSRARLSLDDSYRLEEHCGDVIYLAPEMFLLPDPMNTDILKMFQGGMSEEELPQYDEKVDVWSLGVVLYEVITGRQPFLVESPSEMIAALLSAFPHFSKLVRNSSMAEEEAVSQALSRISATREEEEKEIENEANEQEKRVQVVGEGSRGKGRGNGGETDEGKSEAEAIIATKRAASNSLLISPIPSFSTPSFSTPSIATSPISPLFQTAHHNDRGLMRDTKDNVDTSYTFVSSEEDRESRGMAVSNVNIDFISQSSWNHNTKEETRGEGEESVKDIRMSHLLSPSLANSTLQDPLVSSLSSPVFPGTRTELLKSRLHGEGKEAVVEAFSPKNDNAGEEGKERSIVSFLPTCPAASCNLDEPSSLCNFNPAVPSVFKSDPLRHLRHVIPDKTTTASSTPTPAASTAIPTLSSISSSPRLSHLPESSPSSPSPPKIGSGGGGPSIRDRQEGFLGLGEVGGRGRGGIEGETASSCLLVDPPQEVSHTSSLFSPNANSDQHHFQPAASSYEPLSEVSLTSHRPAAALISSSDCALLSTNATIAPLTNAPLPSDITALVLAAEAAELPEWLRSIDASDAMRLILGKLLDVDPCTRPAAADVISHPLLLHLQQQHRPFSRRTSSWFPALGTRSRSGSIEGRASQMEGGGCMYKDSRRSKSRSFDAPYDEGNRRSSSENGSGNAWRDWTWRRNSKSQGMVGGKRGYGDGGKDIVYVATGARLGYMAGAVTTTPFAGPPLRLSLSHRSSSSTSSAPRRSQSS
mmetsp:Transcript_29416/g.53982  ORF Transcript_29416/g.53982 Transcript_29416/m.53982 type:complete len:950 (-) Transcript_29416:4546-7395(-)